MVNQLASRVTFQEFQSDYRRYSQFLGKMCHTKHCRNVVCQKKNHEKYETDIGFRLQPVIYFLVINFVELLERFKKESIFNNIKNTQDINDNNISEKLMEMLFQRLFPWDNQLHETIDDEWKKVSTSDQRYNIWLTLLNFPEPENLSKIWTLEEKTLRGILMQFIHRLDIHNSNIVVRETNQTRENNDYKENYYKR